MQKINDHTEKDLSNKGYQYICGCDETGVGSLAGDVYCSAVILPVGIDYRSILPGINDSKKISEEKREFLYNKIKAEALAFGTGTASVQEIDEINIYWAKFRAFRRAVENLKIRPDFLLVDGNKEIPEVEIPQMAIIKGDEKSISIAAASIIAKVERDHYIKELSKEVSEDYGWKGNKAYYTKKHAEALGRLGKTKYHRKKYVEKFI